MQLEIHQKTREKKTSTDGDVLLLFRCEELHLARAKQKRKQQLQICLKWFDEEDITVSRSMGLEIMQEVAAKYLNDKDDDALEQHRDDAMAQRGNSSRKARFPTQKKRGAAAVEGDAAASKLNQKGHKKDATLPAQPDQQEETAVPAPPGKRRKTIKSMPLKGGEPHEASTTPSAPVRKPAPKAKASVIEVEVSSEDEQPTAGDKKDAEAEGKKPKTRRMHCQRLGLYQVWISKMLHCPKARRSRRPKPRCSKER